MKSKLRVAVVAFILLGAVVIYSIGDNNTNETIRSEEEQVKIQDPFNEHSEINDDDPVLESSNDAEADDPVIQGSKDAGADDPVIQGSKDAEADDPLLQDGND